MGRLPLRARLTWLTALAVAVAVAGCAIGCWFIVRDQLISQLDRSLSSAPPGPPNENPCSSDRVPDPRDAAFIPTLQVVWANGRYCTAPSSVALDVTGQDLAVASGRSGPSYHNTTNAADVRMRVFTRPFGQGTALMIARPLTGIDQSLDSLTLLLLAIGAGGVVCAASAGMLIARAGLAPVDRLTDAVEHIARTEDLTTTITARGNDEIARLGRSFNSMTAALSSARDRQRRLIADAGHELRTPLTSLRTNIDLLLRSDSTGRAIPEPDRRRLLTNLKEQMAELTSLVDDLLALSRPEGTGQALATVALHEVVENAVRRARLRGPAVTLDVDVRPWFVRGDPAAVERAVINLLDNAVKFSPDDGAIEVRLRGGELTVRDHGPGISAEEAPYVFDRFWRSPSARGLPGSGLGLAIVARVAQETGGSARLEPAPGGGAIARLNLPGSAVAPDE